MANMVEQFIKDRIRVIRTVLVMLDIHLAEMYEVKVEDLRAAVQANMERFPVDFVFQLNEQEVDELVKEQVILSKESLEGALPLAFSKAGLVMLSAVLKSQKAVDLNIAVVRSFVLLREHALNYGELKQHMGTLQNEMHTKFEDIYEALAFHKAVHEELDRMPIGFKKDHTKGST